MYLIGVDVGGTFTDIVFADTESGRTLIHKTPTTRDEPSRGVVAGIGELCARFDLPRDRIDHVLHGTTTYHIVCQPLAPKSRAASS